MELTINGHVYRTNTLNAFAQLHIVRRLTPSLGKLAAIARGTVTLRRDADGRVVDLEGDPARVLGPLAEAVTALSDEDVEYICNACLAVTERKNAGGTWAFVRVNGVTMFDGLTLPEMLQIVAQVVRENLTDFFDGLPPDIAARLMPSPSAG